MRFGFVNKRLFVENTIFTGVIGLILAGISIFNVGEYAFWMFAAYGGAAVVWKFALGRHLQVAALTIPGFFYICYLILFVVPSIIVYSEMTDMIRDSYLHGSFSVLFFFPFGILITQLLYRFFVKKKKQGYASMPFEVTRADLRFKIPVLIGYWVSVVISIIYISYLDVVPILKLFLPLSETYDKSQLRFMFEQAPPLIAFAFSLCRIVIVPTSLMYLYLLKKKRLMSNATFILYAFGAIVLASLTLDRGPVLIIFLMIALAEALSNKGILLRFRAYLNVGALVLIGLLIVSIISAAQSGDVSGETYEKNVYHMVGYRIFLSPAMVASLSFENFPGPDFLNGKYIRIFTFLTSGEYIKGSEAPPLVILPCSFMADLWRNWGGTGVIVGTILIAIYTQLFQLLSFQRKTLLCVIFHAFFLLGVLWLIPGNVIGAITTTVLLIGGLGSFFAFRLTGKSTAVMKISKRFHTNRNINNNNLLSDG